MKAYPTLLPFLAECKDLQVLDQFCLPFLLQLVTMKDAGLGNFFAVGSS